MTANHDHAWYNSKCYAHRPRPAPSAPPSGAWTATTPGYDPKGPRHWQKRWEEREDREWLGKGRGPESPRGFFVGGGRGPKEEEGSVVDPGPTETSLVSTSGEERGGTGNPCERLGRRWEAAARDVHRRPLECAPFLTDRYRPVVAYKDGR